MKSIGKTIFAVLLIALVCGQSMPLSKAVESTAVESEAANQIRFDKDVWPILQLRCVACHNADRAEGDLRFDAGRVGLEQDGRASLTGRAILGPSSTDSELIRRVTSEEIGYRMPKEGPPLTKAEVDTLIEWIDAGADWGTQGGSAASVGSDDKGTVAVLADGLLWFQQGMERQSFRRMVYLAGIALLAVVVLCFLLRRSQSQRPSVSRLKTVTIFALVFLTLATWIHYDGRYKKTLAQKQAVETKLLSYTGPSARAHSLSPPYPMHPPRLGGVYYRGNDERAPQLFNGGFYRTAQLEVWLTDSNGKRLKWGDVVEGESYIEFLITRAAGTTGELFSDQVMSVVGLTDDVRITGAGADDVRTVVGDVIGMETVVADQQWRSRYRLKQLEAAADAVDTAIAAVGEKKVAGKLFLVQNTSRAKAHYGIEFEVLLDDERRILDSSQLWMGSLYNLNGRVFVPYQDQKILLDRWFDFRPIPEISGPQTDDPELLGIPEHQ